MADRKKVTDFGGHSASHHMKKPIVMPKVSVGNIDPGLAHLRPQIRAARVAQVIRRGKK